MTDDQTQTRGERAKQAGDEAAAWYAKLSGQRVRNADLSAFAIWRSDSLNDAAYTRIEDLTTSVRPLADDPRLRAIADTAARRPRESEGLLAGLRR